MKFGIIREGKIPPDKRVPFTPEHCVELMRKFPDLEIVVQSSSIRAFSDLEYKKAGISIVENLADCDVLWGVKEVNVEDLIPNKTYLFFSHTYKEQPYNKKLLQAILSKKIELIDYELLTNPDGNRVVAFGRYAGIVGAYNGLRGVGIQLKAFDLKPAHTCFDKAEMDAQLSLVNLPPNFKIALTGRGRVGGGAAETLKHAGIQEVSPEEYMSQTFDSPVFTILGVDHYYTHPSGEFDKQAFFKNPVGYERNFMPFAKITDLYIACHYWDSRAPFVFTRDDARHPNFKIKMIADVSCDIDGPVAATLRPSTIADPFYGYDPHAETVVPFRQEGSIGVMAVDNLPCELPRDASRDFGRDLIDQVVPQFFNQDVGHILQRATETTKDGKLTPAFAYLANYAGISST
jgi:saccharopine dehydrogenase (NAD+, L-lysine-forming)